MAWVSVTYRCLILLYWVSKDETSFITPNTLVARLFKAKYFPHGSYLSSSLGSNPSFVWRSVWSAKEVVNRGICDAPKPEGLLTTRQLAEYKWMSGYPTPLLKIGQSLLCTGNSTQIQNMYTPAFTCPKQSNICNISNTATWAHKLILIKTDITTILQLSPNNSIVDYTFIQTYINIYKSNTYYVQKPSKL